MDYNTELFSHDNEDNDDRSHDCSEVKNCHKNKNILIVIRPKGSHTMKYGLIIIFIPKGCHTRMTVLMMILKTKK